jgi:3-hydroxyisobutyrate dehydrogenase
LILNVFLDHVVSMDSRQTEEPDMPSGEIRNVAVIGLGRMGARIARNLLKAGFHVTVYNRTASKMQRLIDAGAAGADSPRQAVAAADVVLTSLMDDQSVSL